MRTRIELEPGSLEALDLPGDAPAIVLLHEGLGSVRLWRDFPAALATATGARVVAFSRFGHGDSDPPPRPRTPRFMHDEALRVLPELLRVAGIERPVLVGHSDGGSIALIHANAHPVAGLVLLAPHVFVETISVSSIEDVRAAYLQSDLRERLAKYHADVDSAFWGWNDIWLDPRFRAWNIESEIAGVRCPVLAVQGRDDEHGTLEQLRAIQRRLPWTRILELEDCRHSPHRDQPERLLDAIVDFLDSPSSQERRRDRVA